MPKKVYFKDLDALRSIAALMVFCWHASRLGTSNISNPYLKNFLVTLFDGGRGVLIFFVLSGFLITYLILSEVQQKGSFSIRDFYLRRILRIWPLYFALLIFGFFILLPILGHYSNIHVKEVLSHSPYYFAFLTNFDILRSATGDFVPVSITWSVAIEEQFYMVWPLLFLFTPPKKYHYIFYVVLMASFAFKIWNHDKTSVLYYHTLSVVSYLAIGGLAAYYSLNSEKFRSYFKGNNWFIYVAGMFFLYIQYFLNLGSIIVNLVSAVFFAWVILDQCHNTTSFIKLSRLGVLTKLSKYTYGIYMLHQTVLFSIMILLRIAGWETGTVTILVNFLVGLPVTLVLAWLSYRILEKRFLLLKEKLEFIKTAAPAFSKTDSGKV